MHEALLMRPQENKAEKHRQKTRVVVMLGARFFQQGRGNEFPPRFPLILESKKEGMPKEVVGGDVRMRAIEQLYEEFQQDHQNKDTHLRILTTGGTEEVPVPETGEVLKISRAEQAERKLEVKYGLPEDIVETLPSGGSTLGNAKALAEWLEANKEELGQIEEVEIITNEFHISRAWLMFAMAIYKNETGIDLVLTEEERQEVYSILEETFSDQDLGDKRELETLQSVLTPYVGGLKLRVRPLIAEDVLARRGMSGVKYGELIRHNEHVQETRGFERQGIRDLVDGKYQVK